MMTVESLFTRRSWQGRLQQTECKRKSIPVVGERRQLIVYMFTLELVRTCCYSGEGDPTTGAVCGEPIKACAPGINLIFHIKVCKHLIVKMNPLVDWWMQLEESVVCNKPCP